MRIGSSGGERRGGRLETPAQLGQRQQLDGAVAGIQPPANHPGVEDIPFVRRQDRDADPAPGFHHAHRFQHADCFTGDAAGHTTIGADGFERDHLTGRILAGHDRGAQRGQQRAVQHTAVEFRMHAYILSYAVLAATKEPRSN